jgi:hypothetical protein
MVGDSARFNYQNAKELSPQAPRGLSAEEKRVKLLEIFHDSVC